MNWMLIIGVFVVIVIIVILIIYYNNSSSSTSHSIVYNGATIYSSSKSIINTSDGISTIYYSSSTGVYSYNINTKLTTLVTSTVASGLAYGNGSLLLLDMDGNLYNFNVSETSPTGTNVSALFSTVGGGWATGLSVNGTITYYYNGTSQTPANGNYTTLIYTVN